MRPKTMILKQSKKKENDDFLRDENGEVLVFENSDAAANYLLEKGYEKSVWGTINGFTFEPILPDTCNPNDISRLCHAIVKSACKNYVNAVKSLERENDEVRIRSGQMVVDSLAKFFYGPIFTTYYNLEPDWFVKKLNTLAKTEMEEEKDGKEGSNRNPGTVGTGSEGDYGFRTVPGVFENNVKIPQVQCG